MRFSHNLVTSHSSSNSSQNTILTVTIDKTWKINPAKIYSGTFETSLNGPGFCITLFNATAAGKNSNSSAEELLYLLSADTKAPAWPNVYANGSTKEPRIAAPAVDIEKKEVIREEDDIKGIDPFVTENGYEGEETDE